MTSRTRRAVGLVVLAFLLCPRASLAADKVESLLGESAADLDAGRVDAAITLLEKAADEGEHHPDLSFNRGVAYLRRVGSSSERIGDRGQAAAGFAETLAARSDDAEAQRGLEEAQLSVARKNSHAQAKDGAQVSSPLGLFERALLSCSPVVLFWISVVGSALVSIGAALGLSRLETRRLAGTVSASVGALSFVAAAGLYFARLGTFHDAKMGVVIANQAQVVDASGRRVAGRPPLSESTIVYVTGPERGLLRLVGIGSREHVHLGQVRIVSHKSL